MLAGTQPTSLRSIVGVGEDIVNATSGSHEPRIGQGWNTNRRTSSTTSEGLFVGGDLVFVLQGESDVVQSV